MTFPQGLFPKGRGPIVSYDYFDLANGTGYDIYYGSKADNGEYLVTTTNNIYSEEICSFIENQSVATSATMYFNLDFDILFNLPRNIKGKLFANIPIGIAAKTSAAELDFEYYCIVKAIHVDLVNFETVLATGTSRTVTQSGIVGIGFAETAYSSMLAICIMDSALTHFKKGEKLRFTVEGWYKCLEGGPQEANIMIGHDPRNREYRPGNRPGSAPNSARLANEFGGGGDVIYQATQMSFHIPFVIDTT